MLRPIHAGLALSLVLPAAPLAAQTSFVNWESPHVSPIDITPDGARLLAVNTPDNRLEVFEVTEFGIAPAGSVPVGLDPVSVRARTNTEVWVVNHVSDSVSVVDLLTMNVRDTIDTGDEPTDVVFAGSPERAFVSISQLNQVKVYDPADLSAPPVVLDIEGEDPRAMVTDGSTVYVAIFEAGNGTTILDENVVSSSVNPYPGNPNPPPNSGTGFDPPIDPRLPDPPNTSLIVKRDAAGAYRDVNGENWSGAVAWDLHGHDLAMIDATSLSVSYAGGFMNLNMALSVDSGGDVVMVGLEALNEVRFEPNLNGRFIRVMAARLTPPAANAAAPLDLNPHLDYASASVDPALRAQSLGDPRGIAWSAAGDRAFVTGMGSNTIAVTDEALARIDLIEVGEGPTGVHVDDANGRVYVLNKFESSVSVIDSSALVEQERVAFHDPTPGAIRLGRPHLYDTHANSGLGLTSCGSCHIDGRMDQVAWDLGDPTGDVKPFNQVCNFGFGGCEDWHPMKGPMTTQTLIGIIGTAPFHWRGDREDLAAFNPAFMSLLGADAELSPAAMTEFEDFVATLAYPPNPNRNIDGSLKSSLPGGGNAIAGESLFLTAGLDGVNCVECHAMPSGTNGELTSAILIQESQSMKIPQLRNMHEKTGFDATSLSNNRGFGFIHDGSVDSVFNFLFFDGFQFSGGNQGNVERRDVTAFMMSFSTDTHAGVGVQATMNGTGGDPVALRDEMLSIAASGDVDLVVKGIYLGERRGFVSLGGGQFQSDRADEVVAVAELDAAAGPGAELTYTLVPFGSGERIGVDRDEDGFFDHDEIDACSDPADSTSVPGSNTCPGDIAGGPGGGPDGSVGFADLLALLSQWDENGTPADLDCSGNVDFQDLVTLLAAWGPCG